jgi:hypothetical protein
VAGEAKLETAAERATVDGSDPRLAAGLDAPIQQRQLAVSSMARSAPAQNVSLPEVMTTPLIAASLATSSTMALSSSMTFKSITFIERPGLSQVTSAMPSESVAILKLT